MVTVVGDSVVVGATVVVDCVVGDCVVVDCVVDTWFTKRRFVQAEEILC